MLDHLVTIVVYKCFFGNNAIDCRISNSCYVSEIVVADIGLVAVFVDDLFRFTIGDIITSSVKRILRMKNTDLGKRLKKVRLEKGYTQEILAEKISTTTSYISDIERGVKTPSLSTFIVIINALDVSADYILQGTSNAGKSYLYDEIAEKLDKLTPPQRQFVADFIDVYSKSLAN